MEKLIGTAQMCTGPRPHGKVFSSASDKIGQCMKMYSKLWPCLVTHIRTELKNSAAQLNHRGKQAQICFFLYECLTDKQVENENGKHDSRKNLDEKDEVVVILVIWVVQMLFIIQFECKKTSTHQSV
jgi:hypothetical protein